MSVLMLFLDGVGIGRRDAKTNPFFAARLPVLRSLLGGGLPSLRRQRFSGSASTLLPLDATLGVGGLPQSGTGQTALFTGVNGARLIGKHFGPFPYSTLRPVIEQKNIFRRLLESGRTPCFANAFPQRFFDYVHHKRSRLTVTTLSCLISGVRLLTAEDLAAGRGISADITSQGWPELGYPEMERIPPAEAGRRLVRLLDTHAFVLFEYWKTDHAGHAQRMAEAVEVLERFDAMLEGIVGSLDTSRGLLLITSDHGNLEDLSVKTHTRNPVPAILYGYRHEQVAMRLHASRRGNLMQVTPAIMEYITGNTVHRNR